MPTWEGNTLIGILRHQEVFTNATSDSFWRDFSAVTMTLDGLNICLKHVGKWSGLEALLRLVIIPGSVLCSTCQHSYCVGLAAATVMLVSIWCFRVPENSTIFARCPPSCYYWIALKFRGKAGEIASFCLCLCPLCIFLSLCLCPSLSNIYLSTISLVLEFMFS